MSYKKAADVLPAAILAQIQKYVDGECIYIPRKDCNRKKWGTVSNIKEELADRNRCIYKDFSNGISKDDLADTYCLTVKTIEKIIFKTKAAAL